MAAGESSRLGRPKQLLPYQKGFLLQHVVQQAIDSKVGQVHVILGAFFDQIAPTLKALDCTVLRHALWNQGLGSSIAFGIRHLVGTKIPQGIILAMGDQLYFQKEILGDLVALQKASQSKLVSCQYKEGMGPPCYFDQIYFEDLMALRGDQGAKKLLLKHKKHCSFLPFEHGDVDIDTVSDLKYLEDLNAF